jgi:hypothetical protein
MLWSALRSQIVSARSPRNSEESFRLRQAAEKINTALDVVEQELNASSCSTLQIEMRRAELRFNGALLRGIDVEWPEKHELSPDTCSSICA